MSTLPEAAIKQIRRDATEFLSKIPAQNCAKRIESFGCLYEVLQGEVLGVNVSEHSEFVVKALLLPDTDLYIATCKGKIFIHSGKILLGDQEIEEKNLIELEDSSPIAFKTLLNSTVYLIGKK